MQVYNDELYHFGILGMKWGHHKAVKESAAMTKAKTLLEENKTNSKRVYLKSLIGRASDKDVKAANRELKYAKEDLNKVKILEKLKSNGKTDYQLKMEAKYKEKGMTDDEASVAAYNNIRTKKILAIVGGTALVAATAYFGYKYHKENVDRIIKSGTSLQNIASESDTGLRDTFYSSKNPLDKIKYKGLYGTHIRSEGAGVINKNIKVLSDIKQASPKNAKIALQELIKNDKDFSANLKEYISLDKLGGDYSDKTKIAIKSLEKGLVDDHVYDVFNASLVDHTPKMQNLTDKYFKTLTDKGYNAILDVNDSKYSGYDAINPIIAFNTKGLVEVMSTDKVSPSDISKARDLGYAQIYGKGFLQLGAQVGIGVAGTKMIGESAKNAIDSHVINKYRKEHPNTKLTNTEIIRMIERSK